MSTRYNVTSFGRSFIEVRAKASCTVRRACAALTAAQKRWPNGWLDIEQGSLRWMVPEGRKPPGSLLCGLLITTIVETGT